MVDRVPVRCYRLGRYWLIIRRYGYAEDSHGGRRRGVYWAGACGGAGTHRRGGHRRFWGCPRAESELAAKTLGLPKAYHELRGDSGRQERAGGAHRHAEPAALSAGESRAECRQACAVREAAGDEFDRVRRAGRAGLAQRLRGGGELQYPLLSAQHRSGRHDETRRRWAGSTPSAAATCRIGCSTRPTTTGACWPRRAASCGPSPISGRIGWI